MILLNLCLSDIPKERIYTSPKTGKKYLNVTANPRKGAPEDYTVYIYDKETKNKIFIGKGKKLVDWSNGNKVVVGEATQDDIPF